MVSLGSIDGAALAVAASLSCGIAYAQDTTSADDADLRPAPDFFVDSLVAVTTAQQLARFCTDLSVDPEAVRVGTAEVIERLESDGFDTSRPDGGMLLPQEQIITMQDAFADKHGLSEDEVTEDIVCAAGRAEIAAGSTMGRYLVEVPG